MCWYGFDLIQVSQVFGYGLLQVRLVMVQVNAGMVYAMLVSGLALNMFLMFRPRFW